MSGARAFPRGGGGGPGGLVTEVAADAAEVERARAPAGVPGARVHAGVEVLEGGGWEPWGGDEKNICFYLHFIAAEKVVYHVSPWGGWEPWIESEKILDSTRCCSRIVTCCRKQVKVRNTFAMKCSIF